MNNSKELVIRGKVVDIIHGTISPKELTIHEGRIREVRLIKHCKEAFILPGFLDAHVHIESSMASPSAFAAAALRHGTIGAMADPHEIANVMGLDGIRYMLNEAEGLPFYFRFGASSCVPATGMETSGALIDAEEIEKLLQRDDIHFLTEMMNVPGVLHKDPEVMRKLEAARRSGKPVDGHFPLGRGEALKTYIESGISTDHETISLEEGREKCRLGMDVLIREGSAAKNMEALLPLLDEFPERIMFCTDDMHPTHLQKGYIDQMVRRACDAGYDLIDTLRAASLNPATHYNVSIGMLQEGDSADFILVDDLEAMHTQAAYIKGTCVYENGKSLLPVHTPPIVNNFHAKEISEDELRVKAAGNRMRVIVCEDGELTTKEEIHSPLVKDGFAEADTTRDLLKLVIINRYKAAPPAIAFIRGMELKRGAVAQSIAHDSHNIMAVGTSDKAIRECLNAVIRAQGGIAVTADDNGKDLYTMPLPIAGLMSTLSIDEIAGQYEEAERRIRALGTSLHSLQMTLSFMGLLVIPSLKLSDKGLFDGEAFSITELFL